MTQHEILTPIEKTVYYNLKDPLLFYDISELGWSRYISAHINYLVKNGRKVSVCVNSSREVLYRGFVTEILPIPKSFYEKFGNLVSASHHLHDPIKNLDTIDTDVISKPFIDEYSNYTVIKDYSKFYNQRIFEPYKNTEDDELYCKKFRKCILIFPRCRNSRFSRRNISEDNWIKIINKLCTDFPHLDIISIGGKEGTLNIDLPYKNYYNLVPFDNNLDILVTLCNMGKVLLSFGTQSGITHIATLCKSTTFIVGHDPYDMGIYTENFTNTDIKFYQTIETDKGYGIDIENLIIELLDFLYLLEKIENGITL